MTEWQEAKPQIHIQSVVMDYLLHFLISGCSMVIKIPGRQFWIELER